MEKNVYNYLISKLDFNLIDEFIENTKFIKNVGDEKKFDIELDKGGLIIFDESGVHRGSSPSKNDRAVCRFHFKRLN